MTIPKETPFILAISGGPDSIYLLHRLLEEGHRPILAHFNHQLRRKDSDQDELFVRNLAKEHDLICEIDRADVKKWSKTHKHSIETAGRILRYKFLEKVRKKHRATAILTAHHLNDNLETVLMNLRRGCHLRGLSGMRSKQGYIIRPLLETPKSEILSYLKENNIKYRIDKSNNDMTALRNRTRHFVIPELMKANPNLLKEFREQRHRARSLHLKLTSYAQKWLDEQEENRFSADAFLKLEPIMQSTVLETIYEQTYGNTVNLSSSKIDAVIKLITQNNTGKQKKFGKDLTLRTEYGEVILKHKPPKEKSSFTLTTKNLKSTPKSFNSPNTLYFDADRIPRGLLKTRSWKPGDRFQPSGMSGTKKLQDYFVDCKIPQQQRSYIPVVVTKNDDIVAVGQRIDERFKASKSTKNVLSATLRQQK